MDITDIDELRTKIDKTDALMVKLLASRLKLAGEVGKRKQAQGKTIEDKTREGVVEDNIRRLAREEGLDEAAVADFYRHVINLAKNVQGMTVAFQGEPGAYSEEAAFAFFGPAVTARHYETLEETFRAVEKGETRAAIIPVENSLEGTVGRAYDLLSETPLKVSGEIEHRIVHCLIAHPGARLDEIKQVYSHPQALGQCQNFIRHLDYCPVPAYDTAGSAKIIKEQGLKNAAAIASARAAQIYGMEVLAWEIEDNPHNFTRFLILSHQDSPPTGRDKTSIVFSVKHRPGALYAVLQQLAELNINMTKIESRPTRQKPWEYNFHLDFDGHRSDPAPSAALALLEEMCLYLKVLGSYAKATPVK
jgi:chorismate mutase/prephenate dehydratase